MKKKHDSLGIILAVVAGITFLTAMLVRAFLPRVILPKLDSSAVALLISIALVLDHYLVHAGKRNYFWTAVYAAVIFGVFPWVACFLSPMNALKLAVLGAVIVAACAYLFDSMLDRLSSGPATKAAPVVCAFVLYLVAQCLMGIL